jgi:ankyrin repeat protein
MSNIQFVDLSYEDYLCCGCLTEFYDAECFIDERIKNENILLFHVINKDVLKVIETLKDETHKLLDKRNDDGETSLHISVFMSDYKISEILLSHGADPNAKDDNKQTPFHAVSFMNDKKFVNLMIKYGGDINSQDEYGNTPLHLAVVIKNNIMVKILLECKCDDSIKNTVDLTAKDYAFDDKKILKLFQ